MESQDKDQLKKNAFTFLRQQAVGVIATVTPHSTPEAATVMYIIGEDWSIYILTHWDSRKIENIKTNPFVAFVVGTTFVAHTVQIEGKAEVISSQDVAYQEVTKKFEATELLKRNPIFSIYKDRYVILKITIDWLRWLSFDQITNKEIYTVLVP